MNPITPCIGALRHGQKARERRLQLVARGKEQRQLLDLLDFTRGSPRAAAAALKEAALSGFSVVKIAHDGNDLSYELVDARGTQ